jgi:1-aminocyclopropane-1-carboxylate deaminase/D-cysteine desulfhydrase-like pyridoxal-dependent ACC family enzyme
MHNARDPISFLEFENGCQVELHDNWLVGGNPWELPRMEDAPRFITVDDYDGIEAAITAAAARLTADGRQPYAIPIGGASPPGVRAYMEAAHEFRAQRPDVDVVFVADGSGGTHAGLVTGFGDAGPKVIGVDVGTRPNLVAAVTRMRDGVAEIVIDAEHIGPGYGAADARTLTALKLAARTEALILDPVYTGKAMAALTTWAREGRLSGAASICFWHTGGQPALFSDRYRTQLGALDDET